MFAWRKFLSRKSVAGEILVRVHTCGICGTDLKKIATGSHSAPRIFGHETSGVVAAVGDRVRKFAPGDRVVIFHHIPCRECYYCRHKTFAQCATYKKVGCTAGFEPSGGGFAEYVRVMDWIVEKGTVRIPDGVSFEQACFVEPVNTCIKGIETLRLEPEETVLVIGQGPIGLILATLAKRAGARVITSDLYPARLTIANSFGHKITIDASKADAVQTVRGLTEGRGADAVILAVGGSGMIRPAMDAVRPGGRVLLFAQTVRGEVTIDPSAVCVDEKSLLGSYSASVELQEESVRFVMDREMDLERLISHRFPLERSVEALNLAAHPQPDSMKIVIQPGGGPRRFGVGATRGKEITVTGKMTAAVLYGKEDIKIEKVPIPRVGDGEVLVKVHVALTCGTDLKVYQRGYHARMIVPPALFGHELAGTIEEVGEGVRGFKKGMRVVALNSAPCGMCFYCSKHQLNLCEDLLFNNGAYAEYIRIPRRIVEANMLAVPANVSFEDAAMTEPLACVLRGLHETGVEIGDTVAVIGGGPIGLMFVQVAKAIGCNVIAVVKRDSQVALARKKGAHEVVQITQGERSGRSGARIES